MEEPKIQEAGILDSYSKAVIRVVEQVGKSVVSINIRGQMKGAGSGVIIAPDEYIITNNHVVAGAGNIEVALKDGRVSSAEIIGRDVTLDLAVIRIMIK